MSGGADLVLATRSTGKLRELAPMLVDAGFLPVTLAELGVLEVREEDGVEAFETFEENAVAKARYFLGRCGGRPVLADDSGLEVRALGGAPGVLSKRFAAAPGLAAVALDAANNARLLASLVGKGDRRARYVCVAAIAWRGGELTARGECAGEIVERARGDGGFGYDPLFRSDELGRTFGEAGEDEKGGISHRGRAVRAALGAFARQRGR